MRVCSTHPGSSVAEPYWNDISEQLIRADFQDELVNQQLRALRCQISGMPLVLYNAHYVTLKPLGEGGFGRTFLALDRAWSCQHRVIKQLRLDRFLMDWQKEAARKAFENEANSLKCLNHPRIPRLYPSFTLNLTETQPSSHFYIAQDYIKGVDLQQTLEQKGFKGFDEAQIRSFIHQMLDILKHIHENHLIHRDVKPSNIMVDRQGYYHLIDFGAVKFQQTLEATPGVDISRTATSVGTPGYCPPEQAMGHPQAASDLYALAATCVHLLTARHPGKLLLTTQHPRNPNLDPDSQAWQSLVSLSPKLTAVLDRMLQYNVSDRYASAQEALDALNEPSPPSPPPPPSPISQFLRRRWVIPALLGTIGLTSIALIPDFRCRLTNSCPQNAIAPTTIAAATFPRYATIASVPNVPTGTVRYGGSTTWASLRGAVLPEIERAFPNLKIVYQDPPNSRPYSEAGIRMLIAGDLDFALSSKGIDSNLQRAAAEKGLKLKEIIVAINGNAYAVHPNLGISGLTLDQIEKIESGKMTNWQQVGGPDRRIQVYSTDAQYISGASFQAVRSATEGVRRVANDPAGFFRASAALLVPQCDVKVLPIGWSSDTFVAPYQLPLIPPERCPEQRNKVNINALRSGQYPKLETLSVVIVEDGGRRQQAGEAYANMLLSDQGQALIDQAGYSAYSLQRRLSNGNELLVFQTQSPQKRAGIEAFARQDYATAVAQFTESLRLNKNDPETLIYLHNAQLKLDRRPTYRIAVSVPIGSRVNVAEEILRGVAQAQDEAKTNRIGIEVVIADDRNNPTIAQQIATELVQDPSILAVVGHNTADVSAAAAEIYQANGLVMISPTTFGNVSAIGNYIFRAVPSTPTLSARLAEYLKAQIPQAKVLICYDSQAPDQGVFRQAFVDAFTSRGSQEIVITNAQGQDQCDYASPSFNAAAVIDQAIKQGANAIFVGTNINNFQPTVDLITANSGRLPLFSTPTLYTEEIVKRSQTAAEGLVLVAPWSPASATPAFMQKSNQLWSAPVNWRTGTAYDATQAVIAGLAQSNTREGLRDRLLQRNFSTPGSSGEVRFLETRDRILTPVLLQVKDGKFETLP